MKIIISMLLALTTLCGIKSQAETADKGEEAIYAFGMGTALTDSTAYLTTVQVIPQASLDKKTKFLVYRDEYSKQLKRYLESRFEAHQTCAVIFATSRKAAEKEYLKVRRTLKKDKALKVTELEAGSFTFSPIVFENEE